jgi:DNA-binding PadR family transcriptional regulator
MRQTNGLKFAVLAVIAYNPDGVHGYLLKEQCERILGKFWQLNRSEIYRMLDQLADERWIESVDGESGSPRKPYRITDEGQQNLGAFLLAPPTDVPRPLRQELAVKLLFASAEHVPELMRVIKCQRETCMGQLHSLAVQRRKRPKIEVDPFFLSLLIDGFERIVRAEVSWLDEICSKLTERFGAVATA